VCYQRNLPISLITGGVIKEEFNSGHGFMLEKLGIKEIFLPGTSLDRIVGWVKDNVNPRC
jgi:methylmalonyl-CoA mutase cobalamin-binding subunit